MDWMVGVKVNAGAENTISVGDAIRSLLYQRITSHAEAQPRIAGHVPDQLSVSRSAVSISGGSDDQLLVVYVTWAVQHDSSAIGRLLNSRIVVHIGIISYSLY